VTAPGAEARVFVGAGGGVRALGAGAAHPVHRPADHVAALAVVTHVVLGHPGPQLVLGEAAAHPAGAGPDQLAVVARLVAVAVPVYAGHREEVDLVPEPGVQRRLPVGGA